jgi:hypothetical protein
MALNFANNNSLSSITSLPASISGGGLNLISTQTASGSSSLSFTSGIDSTYKEYVFKFINIHPASDGVNFSFQASTNGGSSYGVTATTTTFVANHKEDGSDSNFYYNTGIDLAQSTNYAIINDYYVNDNDASGSGTLHLFEPSSDTFVKHFIADFNNLYKPTYTNRTLSAGYFNSTSVIDAVDFKFSSGNIDSGVIKLYGIS